MEVHKQTSNHECSCGYYTYVGHKDYLPEHCKLWNDWNFNVFMTDFYSKAMRGEG